MPLKLAGVGSTLGTALTPLTIPDGEAWKIMSIRVLVVNTATVGNRAPTLRIRDTTDTVINDIVWTSTVPASYAMQLNTKQGVTPYSVSVVALLDNFQVAPFDPIFIPNGYDFQYYDAAAIDAAGDNWIVRAFYERWVDTPDQINVTIRK